MHVNNSKGFLVNTVAGSFVLISVLLGYFVHPAFLLFTGFVGFMMILASFTGFCPMFLILKKLGVRETGEPEQISGCPDCA